MRSSKAGLASFPIPETQHTEYEKCAAELKIDEDRRRRRALARERKLAAETAEAKAIVFGAVMRVTQSALQLATERLRFIGVAVKFATARARIVITGDLDEREAWH